jgi:hypothetical protein
MLRRLLVSSAHYILGPFGSDSDLRGHAEKIASRAGAITQRRSGLCGGRGQEACGAITQFVDERRDLRAAAQRPPLRKPAGGGLEKRCEG